MLSLRTWRAGLKLKRPPSDDKMNVLQLIDVIVFPSMTALYFKGRSTIGGFCSSRVRAKLAGIRFAFNVTRPTNMQARREN